MNKVLAVVIAVLVIAAGAWALFVRDDNKTTSSTTGTNSTSKQPAAIDNTNGTVPPPSASTETNSVSIETSMYAPSNITIKKGTMVTWTNNDTTSHTVTKDNADTGPDSSVLAHGDVYRFTYNQTGTFKYHCKLHPDMTGSVTVTE